MDLWQDFLSNQGKAIHKWGHYFPIYERHFAPWRGRTLTFLEIGVAMHKPWHVTVAGDRAYVVVPVTLTFKLHGKPMVESGSVLTIPLQRVGANWRLKGWSWGQH